MSCTDCCRKDKLQQGEIQNPNLEFLTKARHSEQEVEKPLNDDKEKNMDGKPGYEEITQPSGIKIKGFIACHDTGTGEGEIHYPNGNIYTGPFTGFKANKKGKVVFANKDCYEGELKDDNFEGYGILTDHLGNESKGDWKNNMKNGDFMEIYVDGSSYEGPFVDNQKEGFGLFKWNDGSFYRGIFQNDNINGKGRLEWPNNRSYEGEWLDGKMHGNGKLIYEDGNLYVGEFKDDMRCGHGDFTWADGKRYIGPWTDNKQNGSAFQYQPDGSKLKAEFKNGVRLKQPNIHKSPGMKKKTPVK